MIIRVIIEGSNQQNNITDTENIRRGHFSHFGIIGANLFEGFETFEEGNNNNNLSSLLLSGFREELGYFNKSLYNSLAKLINKLAD